MRYCKFLFKKFTFLYLILTSFNLCSELCVVRQVSQRRKGYVLLMQFALWCSVDHAANI
jgi:hypothetical protein